MPRARPVEFKPAQGGRLMSDFSVDSIGGANWRIKRDWRRDLEEEIRSEGYDLFAPNPLAPLGWNLMNGSARPLLLGSATGGHDNGSVLVQPGQSTVIVSPLGPPTQLLVIDPSNSLTLLQQIIPPNWTGVATYTEFGGVPTYTFDYTQPPTGGQPITMVAMARRPNGQIAIVVGTQTTLWRYNGISDIDWRYVEDGYIEAGYFAPLPGTWIQIGSGFSSQGRRWEAVGINGWLVLNNGVDLPVSYRVEEPSVLPIYELREQGVASVGTIWENNGILMCGDIRILTPDALPLLMNGPGPYGIVVDPSTYSRLQARIIWSAPNFPRRFGAIIPVTVSATVNVLILDYPAASIAELLQTLPNFQINILGAGVNGGNITASVVAVNGNQVTVSDFAITNVTQQQRDAVSVAQNNLFLDQQLQTSTSANLASAQAVLVAAQTNLSLHPTDPTAQSNVANASISVSTAQTANNVAQARVTADLAALATAQTALLVDTQLQSSDMNGSIAGQFSDLEGDGSAILKGLTLRTNIVVYKETGIFLGAYNGNVAGPFDFQEIKIPEGTALRHRDTLILLSGAAHLTGGFAFGGAAHVYAGRNAFYRFDLTNQVPMEMPEFQPCQQIFFKATKTGQVFAADNSVTKELFFCFPFFSGPDNALRWDYRFGTVSTTSMAISAAAGVIRPEPIASPMQVVPDGLLLENWFVMGTPTGQLLRYGLIAADAVDSAAITVTLAGTTLTASAPIFTNHMVGWSIKTKVTNTMLAITGFTSATQVTVLGTGPISGETFQAVPAIFHRAGQPYDSTLESGAEAFGQPAAQKRADRFTFTPGSASVNGAAVLTIRAGRNPFYFADILSVPIDFSKATMMPLLLMDYYLGDRIVVSGVNNPTRMASRIWDITAQQARGFGRS